MNDHYYKRVRIGAWIMLLAIVPAIVVIALRFRMDNRHEKLLNQSDEAAKLHHAFRESFGQDEFIVVALSGADLFDWDNLDYMLVALEELEAVEDVVRVSGIPAVYRDTFGAEDAEALEEEMTTTPFYQGLFLSDDFSVAGIMIEIAASRAGGERTELIEGIEAAVAPLRDHGFRVDIVGQPVFNVAINRASMKETKETFPIAAGLALIALLLLFRSIRAAAVVLLCGLTTLLFTIAFIFAIGWELNLITASLPMVLWVLAIANGIHIVSRFQRNLNTITEPTEAIHTTIEELGLSCTLSSVTTAMGFGSLLIADLIPIQQMGIEMAVGVLISLAVNLILGSYLVVLFKVPGAVGAGEHLGHFLEKRVRFTMTHPWPVVGVFVAFAAFGIWSVPRIDTQADSLEFLPDKHPVTESFRFVADHLTGMSSLEIVAHAPGGWTNPEYWPAFEHIRETLESEEMVRRVYSPLEFLKKINQWDHDIDPEFYTLPESREAAEALLDKMEDEDREGLDRFIAEDGELIRFSVLVSTKTPKEMERYITMSRELAADLPAPLSGHVTGIATRMQSLSVGLPDTQMKSYAASFVLIFMTLLIALRSFRLLVLAVLPNVMPLLVVFASMALLEIPLNTATVMVASISLGIAVDDTVHFLVGYRRHRHRGEAPLLAAGLTIRHIGPSITMTTIAACVGFCALIPSSFAPISNLGALAALAIFAALICDLFLLPAEIAILSGKRLSAGEDGEGEIRPSPPETRPDNTE